MRHNKKFNHLGRQSAHRKSMLANMASSLIMHKRIETTVAKAKALKIYVEPLITKAKEDTTHSRRVVFSKLRSKEAVTEMYRVVAPAVGDRPGGYTRILKIGFRLGDAADMCIIELVDFNEGYAAGAPAAGKAKTRRGRAGAAKKEAAGVTDAVVVEEGAEGAEAPAAEAKKDAPAKKAAPKKAPVDNKAKVAASKAAQKTAGKKVVAKKAAPTKA